MKLIADDGNRETPCKFESYHYQYFFSANAIHIYREPVNQDYAEVNTLMVGAAPEKKDSKGTTQQKSVIR